MIEIKTPKLNIRTAEARERLSRNGNRAYKHTRTTSTPVGLDIHNKTVAERREEVNSRINPDSLDRNPNYIKQAELVGLTAMTFIAMPVIADGFGWVGEQIDKSDPANHIVIPTEVQDLPSDPADLIVTVTTPK